MKTIGVFALVGVVGVGAVHAQVTVRSPEAEASKEEQLASPMVLDFPIPQELLSLVRPGSPKPPTVRLPMPDFEKYVCENVKIRSITLIAQAPDKKGSIHLQGNFTLTVKAGGDRLVHFELAVVSGERTIARQLVARIDAEERKTKTKRLSLDIAAAALASEPPPTFRITMDVRDNS